MWKVQDLQQWLRTWLLLVILEMVSGSALLLPVICEMVQVWVLLLPDILELVHMRASLLRVFHALLLPAI